MEAREFAEIIAKTLYDKKAQDIDVLDIYALTHISDYFIICTGTSSLQLKALSDSVIEKTDEIGVPPLRIEGLNSAWILIDFGYVVVHIFKSDARDFYGLERLWSDAKKININFQ